MKTSKGKLIIRSILFLLIFCLILTFLTLIYLPKRNPITQETVQAAGFYKEPEQTIDVLYLGSCNMYSSVSPLLIYEEYGITGYAFCVPDQEMSTSYYYLKEALKTQNLKAVVLESLFLTNTSSRKREYYNRFALDYFPLNLNKIKLASVITKNEIETMRKYDSTTPDALLTFAGYIFPILRYHSRTDIHKNDLTFFYENDLSNFYKGGFPQYDYSTMENYKYDKVFNGNTINKVSLEYVPKIKALCDEYNIPLIIAKSPNYARWGYDDAYTKIVRDYAKEIGADFLDFQSAENNNFELYDYGHKSGRLNVYGVKKFSSRMGKYLVENVGLRPTVLSDEDAKSWDECVERYYDVAQSKGTTLIPGQIAQIKNLPGAISVRWNPCDDSSTYSVYRSDEKEENYILLTDDAKEIIYVDEDVVSGRGYTYYVVPNEGKMAGQKSSSSYFVYIDMPINVEAKNDDGSIKLSWDAEGDDSKYLISRRTAGGLNFNTYDTTSNTQYTNKSVDNGILYYYKIYSVLYKDNVRYMSAPCMVYDSPINNPVITKISTKNDSVTIAWEQPKSQTHVQVWRSEGDANNFVLLDTISGDLSTYTDTKVQNGIEYYYKIKTDVKIYSHYFESIYSNTYSIRVSK